MNTINDPAWFYSSLAQTAAAIVGLVCAILGSRIIDHIGVLRAEQKDLNKKIRAASENNAGRIRHFESFGSCLARDMAENDAYIKNNRLDRLIGHESFLGGGSWSGGSGNPINATEYQKTLQAEQSYLAVLASSYKPLSGEIDLKQTSGYAANLRKQTDHVPDAIRKRDGVINLLRGDAEMLEALLNDIVEYRGQLLPKSFALIFFLMIWLLITSVFWPLLALPGLTSSSAFTAKSGMVWAFGLGLLGLIVYLSYQLWELQMLGRLRWEAKPE